MFTANNTILASLSRTSPLHVGELGGYFSIPHGKNVNASQVPWLTVAHLARDLRVFRQGHAARRFRTNESPRFNSEMRSVDSVAIWTGSDRKSTRLNSI